MQINGTTLTKRQKALIGSALLREQARFYEAMRMVNIPSVDPRARHHVTSAITLTIDELNSLIDMFNNDEEAAK